MTPDRLAEICALARQMASTARRAVADPMHQLVASDVPDLLAEVERLTADVAQLQAAGEHQAAQLRQAKEERAAVALERDEAWNDRELALEEAAAEREFRVGLEAERDALLPVAEAATEWRDDGNDPSVIALIVAVDEWKAARDG